MAIRAPDHRLQTGLVRWEHLGLVFPAKREVQLRIKLSSLASPGASILKDPVAHSFGQSICLNPFHLLGRFSNSYWAWGCGYFDSSGRCSRPRRTPLLFHKGMEQLSERDAQRMQEKHHQQFKPGLKAKCFASGDKTFSASDSLL